MLRRRSLLIFKVVGQRSRSQGQGQDKPCGRNTGQAASDRIAKLCILIQHVLEKKPIDVQDDRSKVKVTGSRSR